MDLPDVLFSNWTPWAHRQEIPAIADPGVYALAHFLRDVPETVDPQAVEIIYFGETCGSLHTRLNQFAHSAFEGGNDHCGGRTYRELFGDEFMEKLFVSAFPPHGLNDILRPLFIRYLERKLILDYALKWGTPPVCNRR